MNMTTKETERKVRFVVIWERIANSGIFETMASSHEDAIKKLGYNPEYVKMTCFQINGDSVVIGRAN